MQNHRTARRRLFRSAALAVTATALAVGLAASPATAASEASSAGTLTFEPGQSDARIAPGGEVDGFYDFYFDGATVEVDGEPVPAGELDLEVTFVPDSGEPAPYACFMSFNELGGGWASPGLYDGSRSLTYTFGDEVAAGSTVAIPDTASAMDQPFILNVSATNTPGKLVVTPTADGFTSVSSSFDLR